MALSHQPAIAVTFSHQPDNLHAAAPVQAGMRYLITLFLLVLHVGAGRAQAPTDIHGTWTAEIHTGKVYLQVRTAPPPDWNRSRQLERRLEHGPELPGRGARRAARQRRPVHAGARQVRPAARGRDAGLRRRRSATAAAPACSRSRRATPTSARCKASATPTTCRCGAASSSPCTTSARSTSAT